MSFGMKKKRDNYFKYILFYNVLIEKPNELQFYDELSVVEL